MNRITILTLVVASLLFTIPPGSFVTGARQQRAEMKKCPTVEVKGPKRSKGTKPLTFRARIRNLPNGLRPSFRWSVDGADIVSGQSTDLINVQPFSSDVTATVVLENVPDGCQSTNGSFSTEVSYVIACSLPPVVNSIEMSPSSIVRSCSPGTKSETCATTSNEVKVTAYATDTDNNQFLYTWSVTAGRFVGEGRTVTWDLSGVPKGTYTITVEINDGNQHTFSGSATVTVSDCADCKPINLSLIHI